MADSSAPPSPGQKMVDLTIESMTYGGQGVARSNGRVYFVEQGFPGDEVRCQIIEDKERFAIVQIREFLKKSTARIAAQCPASGTCGGCQWQEAPYELQLQWKRQFVADALHRIGKIETPPSFEVVPSSQQFNYRNRVMLRGSIDLDGTIRLGYFMKESKVQVHVSNCAIASAPINRVIAGLSEAKTKIAAQKFRLELQELPLASGRHEPSILATVFPAERKFGNLPELTDELQKLPDVLWSGMMFDVKGSPASVFELDRNSYYTLPGLFQQVNTPLNLALRHYIESIVNELDPKQIVDLYCGSGNLSLGLASSARRIDGVEFDRRAIQIAKYNVNANHCPNVKYDSGDAETWLRQFAKSGRRTDVVIADPPRKGMKEILTTLVEIGAKHIIYVSCDPATLARDIGILFADYEIRTIRCFDFFPNTYHVETVVHLAKRG